MNKVGVTSIMPAGLESAPNGNNWPIWSKYVLTELQRHNECLLEVSKELGNIRVEVAKLKLQAGLWGALAGLIPVVGTLCWYVLSTIN